MEPLATVIVPAHNEETTVGRLLDALSDSEGLDVVVVCNGCTDGTVQVARARDVRVIEVEQASKTVALRAGLAAARSETVVLVDADVVITGADVVRMTRVLGSRVLVAGPVRRLDMSRSSRPVRAYLRLWEQLPAVRWSLAGRGVVALGSAGVARVRNIPEVIADDLWIFQSFAPEERAEVWDVAVTVVAPRRVRDLINRRVRVQRGTEQVERLLGPDPSIRTSRRDLARTAATPHLLPGLPVLLYVSSRARSRARRAGTDVDEWLRDASSR